MGLARYAAVGVVTKRRFPSWRFVGVFALIVVVAFAMLAWWAGATIPTGGDAREAHAICDAVNESGLLPSDTHAEWTPGRRRSTIHVYGVRDAPTQDRVVDVVRSARERLGAKPVSIEFRTALTIRVPSEGPGITVSEADHGDVLRTALVE